MYVLMGAGFATGAAIVSTVAALLGMGAKKMMDSYEARMMAAQQQQPQVTGQYQGQVGAPNSYQRAA